MAKYKARGRIPHGSLGMLEPGAVFESEGIPGLAWEPLDAAAKAAVTAKFGKDAVKEHTGDLDAFDPLTTQVNGPIGPMGPASEA